MKIDPNKDLTINSPDYCDGSIAGIKKSHFSSEELRAVESAGHNVEQYVAKEAPKRAVPTKPLVDNGIII